MVPTVTGPSPAPAFPRNPVPTSAGTILQRFRFPSNPQVTVPANTKLVIPTFLLPNDFLVVQMLVDFPAGMQGLIEFDGEPEFAVADTLGRSGAIQYGDYVAQVGVPLHRINVTFDGTATPTTSTLQPSVLILGASFPKPAGA